MSGRDRPGIREGTRRLGHRGLSYEAPGTGVKREIPFGAGSRRLVPTLGVGTHVAPLRGAGPAGDSERSRWRVPLRGAEWRPLPRGAWERGRGARGGIPIDGTTAVGVRDPVRATTGRR